MRLLLDTHIAVWAALDPAALHDAEHRLMSAATGPLCLSAVSVWGLAGGVGWAQPAGVDGAWIVNVSCPPAADAAGV